MTGKKGFISLRVKMTLGVILICFVIGMLAIFSVSRIASNMIDKEYGDKAEEIAEAVVNTLDPEEVTELTDAVMDIYKGVDEVVTSTEWGTEEWETYMSNYDGIKELPVFKKIQEHFRVYQDIFKVDCIYIMCYPKGIKHAVYIVDGAYGEDECPPGCVDSFDDGIWPDENDPVVPATITNEEVYGWLVSAGYPVISDGRFVADVCVDISMNDIRAKENGYVVMAALLIAGLTILLLVISLLYVSRNVIDPVKKLSETAENYCSENNNVVHHAFEKLEIRTNDEIGQLLSSLKQMEEDMNANISTLMNTKVALKESQELATKDALTGIRNKMAYDYEVEKLEKDLADGFNEFGLAMVDLNFLKKTNDTYGHEKGNISIRRLCMLVCEVFEHSPVFRIGGDEFIIILRNRDYREIDRLIGDFNSHLKKCQDDDTLKPWEQISAAIGYAKFDKSVDQTVEDVFKRADKVMYENKVAMKAQRKD